jgi:RHS repeat-associated protein
LDIYGKVRTFAGRSLKDCPFRYQGQYEDSETGLYYNRFRYYDPTIGSYISQDPIGLVGNNPTLYGYVRNVNAWCDIFGLVSWKHGKFGEWFDNASVQDIINNKDAVSEALRGSGGMHEKFPVSIASKAKELKFSYDELMSMTMSRNEVYFENVPDNYGGFHSGPHATGTVLPEGESSKASSWFHKDLIEKLKKAQTKIEALEIIETHHKKYVANYH